MTADSAASSDPSASDASAETYLDGTVVRSTGSWYEVQTDRGVISSKVRGKFRLEEQDTTNPVAVGDRVTLRLSDDDTGYITDIHERHNKLSRRAAGRRIGKEHVIVANVDRAWAVQAVAMPRFNPGFIDRFLVMAGVHEIPAALIFNKTDLLEGDDEELTFYRQLYEDLGYPVHLTSAEAGDGIEALRAAMTGGTNVIAGPSGTGKSTLLNAVEPGLDIRTGAVSQKTRKGKHTTTYAALYPLAGGGFVADTPGIREFGLVDLEPDELGHFFAEFFQYLDDCRFPNCTHDHEPGCAVKDAVDAGDITEERYGSYLNILDGLLEGEGNVGR